MSESRMQLLPIHGFVLAGGKSSRMGRDKALLEICGRPMVEIAVEKLRSFCAEVSIAGNRDDLSIFAPVVRESQMDAGPVAGIEAGLLACTQPWAMFLPVDVPLVPRGLMWRWAEAVLANAQAGCALSFLLANQERQPVFCLLRRSTAPDVQEVIHHGERRIDALLYAVDDADRGWLWVADAEKFAAPALDIKVRMEFWFSNVNTPHDFEMAELWAEAWAGDDADPLQG